VFAESPSRSQVIQPNTGHTAAPIPMIFSQFFW
jgi:hypothetical protein